MKKNKAYAAFIVDGYSTGRMYARKLNERGIDCVHIQSTEKIPKAFAKSFHREDYIANYIFTNNIETIIAELKQYKLKFILPGCETGVELADVLCDNMQLFANDISLSQARRDKFVMIERVKTCGLATPQYFKSNDIQKIVEWSKTIKDKPIVIKPLRSGGSELVIFCYSEQEIEAAVAKIINTPIFLQIKNEQVLAESFLEGTEYIVNSVSWKGKHYVSEIWVCGKKHVPGAAFIYDYFELLAYDFPVKKQLVAYAFKVLDAQGIKYGTSHAQIMWTKTGPKLIENAARPMGAIDPHLTKTLDMVIGRNQIDLTLESYLRPKQFEKIIKKPCKLQKNMFVKTLISDLDGNLKQIKFLDQIKKLPSFHALYLNVSEGQHLTKTVDFFSAPGEIILVHEDRDVAWQDYKKIAELEETMFAV